MADRRTSQVVLQPTSLCNLNCTYCYVPNRQDKAVMDPATLEAAISKVLRSELVRGQVEFLWHAGEPLAAGRAHYENAVALIDRYRPKGLDVLKSIQTNGTLIDDWWCRFFIEQHFSIGLSVDGPAELHDASRVNWAGKGSHVRVMAGFRKLVAHGIVPGAICVLRRESLQFADEIFDFFVQNGFRSVGFNVEEVENRHLTSTLTPTDSGKAIRDEYRKFVERLYERWSRDPSRITIREFDDLFSVISQKLADKEYIRQPLETQPLAIVTIQKNGDVSTFSPEFAGGMSARYSNFVIGNINELKDLDQLASSPVLHLINADVQQGIDACADSCPYFDLCGAGYTSNKFFENNSLASTETTACRLHRQELTDMVIAQLAG